jgi:hypothetical protein
MINANIGIKILGLESKYSGSFWNLDQHGSNLSPIIPLFAAALYDRYQSGRGGGDSPAALGGEIRRGTADAIPSNIKR